MEQLFNMYPNEIIRGENEFKMFATFFSTKRTPIQAWLEKRMKNLHSKDDTIANKLRCQGNALYLNKKFESALKMYTRALCNATFNGETFGLILANKSAVSYMMRDYQSCLKDIDFCLCSPCPESSKMKVHVRRIKCYLNLNLKDATNKATAEALQFLERTTEIDHKSEWMNKITGLARMKTLESVNADQINEEAPNLDGHKNPTFLCASSSVRLSYSKAQGRHVRANKQLNKGDILFIEKPFVFAPVFANDQQLPLNKCYNCLETIKSCIPCDSCIRCIFCNDKCRQQNWDEFHQWECTGMQADLWYDIGIAFPALRALIKGVPSGFYILNSDFQADTLKYGDKQDNYPYFNKLISNISKMSNILPIVINATLVILYLKEYTEFFEWVLQQPRCPKESIDDLVVHLGGLLVRHIAQLQCNASVIVHSTHNCDTDSVACAIYPSISMMNHSCKPNISMHYVRDTVIVRADEVIEENDEVFNCYGTDYRSSDWYERQERCRQQYYFDCHCTACLKQL